MTKAGIERRHRGVAIDIEAAPLGAEPFIGMDFGDLEQRFIAMYGNPPCEPFHRPKIIQHYDSPAGPGCGQVLLLRDGRQNLEAASGNARQRRRQIREWKRQGFTVKQYNCNTHTHITR
jgi:hypothetical protein